jgi:hypothetical protein
VETNDNNDKERNLSSSSSSSSSHPQFSAYTTLNNLKKQYSIEENANFINFGKVKEKYRPAILLKEKEKDISDKSKLQKSFTELFSRGDTQTVKKYVMGIREIWRIRCVVYLDDLLLLHPDKKHLKQIAPQITKFLQYYG